MASPPRISRYAERPGVPLHNPNAEEHRRQLANRVNASLPVDGSLSMGAPLTLAHVPVSGLTTPFTDGFDPALWEGAVIYVPTQGIMFSDGVIWALI